MAHAKMPSGFSAKNCGDFFFFQKKRTEVLTRMEFVLLKKLAKLEGTELWMFIGAIVAVAALIAVLAVLRRNVNRCDLTPSVKP